MLRRSNFSTDSRYFLARPPMVAFGSICLRLLYSDPMGREFLLSVVTLVIGFPRKYDGDGTQLDADLENFGQQMDNAIFSDTNKSHGCKIFWVHHSRPYPNRKSAKIGIFVVINQAFPRSGRSQPRDLRGERQAITHSPT